MPSVSSRIQQTLDPCVVLMKELMSKHAPLWQDKGGIFSLAQGVVYWKPPNVVSSALIQALQDDLLVGDSADSLAAAVAPPPPQLHTYGPDEGLPALRGAIQQKIKRENALTNHDVMVTVGANQAYTNCILSLVNQDQKVVVFAPFYFNHIMLIQMALPSESLVVGPCSEEGIPDLTWLEETLKADPSIHMITIVNPGNPTGVTLPRKVLQKSVDLCRDHNAWLTLDCTYEYFVNVEDSTDDTGSDNDSYALGGCFPDRHVLHIFSFSKSYAMAGYRCGYIVMSRDASDGHQGSLFEQMLKVQDTIPIAPARIAQVAALAAMQEDDDENNENTTGAPGKGKRWVQEQFETLQTGRGAICQALETLGGPIMGGTGAMYVMAKLPSSTPDDKDIAELLVRDYGVAVIPGSFCGFPGWIRVCYSNLPPERCLEAAARLKMGLAALSQSPQIPHIPRCGAFGPSPQDKPRRQKKNKYSNKSAANDKDPLELLMEESKQKMEQLDKKAKSKSKQLQDSVLEEIEAIKNEPRSFAFPDNKNIDPNEPSSFGFIEIGTVIGSHGVHGEIKVKSSSGFPGRFTEPGVKYFKPLNKRAPRKVFLVCGKRTKDDEYILQLDSVQNREEAAKLRGGMLFVREEDRESGTNKEETQAATEKEEEYFISDLVGLEVFLESVDGKDSSNPFVGTVAGIVLSEVPGLGHDMLEVNLPRGRGGTTSLRDELVLIPFVPQIVPRVSISEGAVFISPPEGLLDLTYAREEKIRIKGFLPSAD